MSSEKQTEIRSRTSLQTHDNKFSFKRKVLKEFRQMCVAGSDLLLKSLSGCCAMNMLTVVQQEQKETKEEASAKVQNTNDYAGEVKALRSGPIIYTGDIDD